MPQVQPLRGSAFPESRFCSRSGRGVLSHADFITGNLAVGIRNAAVWRDRETSSTPLGCGLVGGLCPRVADPGLISAIPLGSVAIRIPRGSQTLARGHGPRDPSQKIIPTPTGSQNDRLIPNTSHHTEFPPSPTSPQVLHETISHDDALPASRCNPARIPTKSR